MVAAGHTFGESSSSSDMSSEAEQTDSWSSERQNGFSSTSSTRDDYDENTLLTDDEVNQQSQASMPPNTKAY